jgi:Ser-tRNA(Ala) deacylase AlaX
MQKFVFNKKGNKMSKWIKTKAFVIKADNKFIDQVSKKETAEKIANRYKLKGCKVTIKEVEVESMAVSFGVI